MGIFGRRIGDVYGARATQLTPAPPSPSLAISSPWAPQSAMVTFALDEALGGLSADNLPMTRDVALRVPGIQRAHGIHVTQFGSISWFQMDGAARTPDQPRWMTTSASGVSPYHRMVGLGSDMFFDGWGCLGFTADMGDCLHIPFGLWKILDDGTVWVDPEKVPAAYRARPVAIPVGYGFNGILHDGIDTIREARQIEQAYVDRLNNPVPLTILGIPRDVWEGMTPEERVEYQQQWVTGRKNGGVALKVAEWPVDMPGQVATDLYESGRNAVRLDIANHTHTPASALEGLRQGGSGGGTEMSYTGVGNDGATRGDLWDFGLAKRFMLAFEGRMSLDDICATGLSVRGDISNQLAVPTPATNATSED